MDMVILSHDVEFLNDISSTLTGVCELLKTMTEHSTIIYFLEAT